MRVACDVRLLTANREPTGVARYAESLLAEMAAKVELELFSDAPLRASSPLSGARLHIVPRVPMWQQTAFPLAVGRSKADVVHSLAFTAPISLPCPSVVTIHDLGFIHSPELTDAKTKQYLRVLVPMSVRRAKRVIVPSAAVSAELVRHLNVPSDKITVVHHGVFHGFQQHGRLRRALADGRACGTRGKPFLLAVGAQVPRKNLLRLVEAFNILCKSGTFLHDLVLVGPRGSDSDRLSALCHTLGLTDRVIMVDFVPDEELTRLYAAAAALVYPSLFEGFGLPVLEAMSAGCPVVVSNRPALPEVAGDAAIYVDPTDPMRIAEGVLEVLIHSERYVNAGRARARKFSWKRAAEETLKVYVDAVSENLGE